MLKTSHVPPALLVKLLALLIYASSLLSACGSYETASDPNIVGGEAVGRNGSTSVAGFLLKETVVSGGGTTSRVCTATRVAPRIFLGAASCFELAQSRTDALLLAVNSEGKQFREVGISRVHIPSGYDRATKRMNVALVEVYAKRPDVDADLGTTTSPLPLNIDLPPLTRDQTVVVAGYGCESVDTSLRCTSAPTLLRHLKALQTTVDEVPAAGGLFKTKTTPGSIAEGDAGGPVWADSGVGATLVGVHSHLAPGPSARAQSVHTWLGDADVKAFLQTTLQTPGAGAADPFRTELHSVLMTIYLQLKACAYDVRSEPTLARFNDTTIGSNVIGVTCAPTEGLKLAKVRALRLALATAEMAELAHTAGKTDDAYALLELAKSFLKIALDIGIGLTPAGPAKDLAEAVLGMELLPDFAELADFDRGVRVVSALAGPFGKATKLFFAWGKRSTALAKLITHVEPFIDWAKGLQAKADELLAAAAGYGRTKVAGLMNGLESVLEGSRDFVDEMAELVRRSTTDQLESFSRVLAKAELRVRMSPLNKAFIKNQLKSSSKILGAGEEFTATQIERMARRFIDLETKIARAPATTVDETVWRALARETRLADGTLITNTEEAVFTFHPGTTIPNHRYSAPGDTAIYGSIGDETTAWDTMLEEMDATQPFAAPMVVASKRYRLDKVLDLTDAGTLDALGIDDAGDLVLRANAADLNKYELTHMIGNIARAKGYKALKVYSARKPGGINLVIFPE